MKDPVISVADRQHGARQKTDANERLRDQREAFDDLMQAKRARWDRDEERQRRLTPPSQRGKRTPGGWPPAAA